MEVYCPVGAYMNEIKVNISVMMITDSLALLIHWWMLPNTSINADMFNVSEHTFPDVCIG